jgi:ABC-type phosphate transport system substrate-binding protein
MTSFLWRALVALALVGSTIVAAPLPAHAAGTSILGGGSGFAALEIDQWRADTARTPFNLTVNYVAQGSTFGRTQFAQSIFDYGASDIQYIDREFPLQRCNGRPPDHHCFVYVPVSAGGLAFMYNLKDGSGNRINTLKLTRRAVCKIFTGAITKWNDPEIVATNPQLASYSQTIHQIVRADGAGESYVFSEYCMTIAPDVWQAFIAQQAAAGAPDNDDEFRAGRPTSSWPQNLWGNAQAIASADGTANFVADPVGGPGSITYVAAGYAKVRNFPTASIENGAHVFTQPDETNVTVALQYATGRANGTFKLAYNGPDPRSYFPSTYSYVLAQTAGFDPGKGATLGRFLCYAVTKGQAIAPALRYARLSSELVDIAIGAIVQIPGAPSAAACPVAGAPPPPPPPSVCTGNCGGGGPTAGGGGSPSGSAGGGSSQGDAAGTRGAKRAAARRPTTAAGPAQTAKGARSGRAGEVTADARQAGAESADALLASETTRKESSRGSSSLWLLAGGAVAMLVVTTAWQRRRPA